ncbi:hypothetical protein [Aureivirga marina]|uniref:hypothetical protein n=1 Tax=Aureivirga marina TaxID=1182451 RepID=UPI0018C98A06|nr:hypothetical protein [Aureivirga marina]
MKKYYVLGKEAQGKLQKECPLNWRQIIENLSSKIKSLCGVFDFNLIEAIKHYLKQNPDQSERMNVIIYYLKDDPMMLKAEHEIIEKEIAKYKQQLNFLNSTSYDSANDKFQIESFYRNKIEELQRRQEQLRTKTNNLVQV